MDDPDAVAGDQPRRDVQGNRPPRPATAGHLVGRVEGSTTRVEPHDGGPGSETTLTFRLLGRRGQQPREVRLRGSSISGSVHDGDWVEVGERERSGSLQLGELLNLTTGTEVRVMGDAASGGAPVLRIVVVIVVVLVLLLVLGVVLGGALGHGLPFGVGHPVGGGDDGRLEPGST